MAQVSYEVILRVRQDLVASFTAYMREKHIRDVMQTGLFIDAHFERESDYTFRARYTAASAADLESYISQHAPRLRADVSAHFPDGIEIRRQTWTQVAEFGHGSHH